MDSPMYSNSGKSTPMEGSLASGYSGGGGDRHSPPGHRATTIGTIVVRSGPVQLVIAILMQNVDEIHIKVVEIEPKLTALGESIDEAVSMQRDHDDMLRKIQGLPSPTGEFARKADKLLISKRMSPDLAVAMADTLQLVWDDVLKLIHDRKHLLDLCASFHDKFAICRGKMATLEVSCKDTLIPMEVAEIQEFLTRFKQSRIEVLTTVMAALKDGNELLSSLQEIAQTGTVDSRPDHIKRDALRGVSQVQQWLENLHDRRNMLESAWQAKKTQLEQCLALSILAKDLDDVERSLNSRRNAISGVFSLGDCELTSTMTLNEYVGLKHDALLLRDRALKITRTTEKLLTSSDFLEETDSCSRAYHVLSQCTEYVELIDQREHWLHQSKDFFTKAEKTLSVLEKLEVELPSSKLPPNTPESFAMYAKVMRDLQVFTEEPLRLGYGILDDVGRTKPETQGVKRVLDEMENRKIYIEGICSSSSEEQVRVEQALNNFLEYYNSILSWLLSIEEEYLTKHRSLGANLAQSKSFLQNHHRLMQDLEFKGEDINSLLEHIKSHLESLNPHQRYDVDSKAEYLHKHWITLKEVVLKRVDLVTLLITFYENAEKLSEMFEKLQSELQDSPEEHKLHKLHTAWTEIKDLYLQLKAIGAKFLSGKVSDSYLEMKSSSTAVEEILNGFSDRQFDVTTSLENWTTVVVEKKEIEIVLEKIMNENQVTAAKTTTVDAQLYPVFTSPSEDAKHLQSETFAKLTSVCRDIDKAKTEIEQRITTTLSIETSDAESKQKIEQVANNLRTLQTKLDGIHFDYKSLLESILSFLENNVNLRAQIDAHFAQRQLPKSLIYNGLALSHHFSETETLRDRCMDKFRSQIAESERLIDRVRVLEPQGAREHDTDRILKLLENLRIHFESTSADRMADLKKLQNLANFTEDRDEIVRSLCSVSGQLDDIDGQKIDSLAAAKTTSLAFEYFERTIELLDKRIDNFLKSSESLYETNPESESFIRNELDSLRTKWEDVKGQVRLKRNALNSTNEYFTIVEKIEAEYKEISYFLSSVTNKITYLREPVEAGNLINDIENYTSTRQMPLREKLDRAVQLAADIPNPTKISTLQVDVSSLFQSFVKLKTDIAVVEERLKTEERQREQRAQEELRQKMAAEARQKAEEEQRQRAATEAEALRKEAEMNAMLEAIKYAPPRFTRLLSDATTKEGNRFVFECDVTGNPQPDIEWFKDGISIQANADYRASVAGGVCTLIIEETFAADTARFMCRASNLVGASDTSANLTVTENPVEAQMSPPNIVKFLENGKAREGSSFHFQCIVTGNPLPTVQWFKNEKCIDDSQDYAITFNNGEANLRFDEVFLEDDAVYTCNVTNPIGFQQCSAKLTVEPLEPTEAPFFRTPLTNIMARVGQKIKLDCTVSGIPRPDIYFTHNGKPYSGRDIKYENDRVTLVIHEAYPNDAGIYVCTAKNLAGDAYSSCNVSVKGRLPNETSDSEMASDIEPIKPSVQLPLKDVSIFEGKSVRLDCVIVGQPEPEVIWYHNGRPVKESADVQLLFQGDRCSLVIREAYTEDAGAYKVVAINSAGEASSMGVLTITPLNIAEPATRTQSERIVSFSDSQPRFEKFLSDVLAPEGDAVTLECVAHGEQPLTAKWYLTNKELVESDRVRAVADAPSGSFKLVFQQVQAEDKGVYTVKVSNSAGDAKCFSHLIVKSCNAPENQRSVQLEIDEKYICPTFKELFSHHNAHQGEMAKFECIVKGKPTPKIKWFFNDQPVHGKDFLISTSGDRQVLTIPVVSVDTVGKVSCVAENDIGKATCVAYLNLIGDGLQRPAVDVQSMSQEHNTESSRVTIKKQMFTTTSTSEVNSYEGNLPQPSATHIDPNFRQPETLESHHYQQFRQQTTDSPVAVQQKSVVSVQQSATSVAATSPKSTRKQLPPRFTSELVSKIADVGSHIVLEAAYEGFPSPDIKVHKNGENLFENSHVRICNKLNKVTIDIDPLEVKDGGRYSVLASNPSGESTCTADVIVKKRIFPPVFGHRLQPQTVKLGDRAVLEVEVTGTPDPTVAWFKDNLPIGDSGVSQYHIKTQGSTYTLVVEHARPSDAGKYMVKATNSGGEAQNIANFVVVESTPQGLVDVSTGQDVADFKHETFKPEPPSFYTERTESATDTDLHGTSESKIVTEHRCTTEATMRLEHTPAYLDLPQLGQSKIMVTDDATQTPLLENGHIESSSISKKSSFEYFKKIESQPIAAPHVAADEKYTKFDEMQKTLDDVDLAKLQLTPGSPPEICYVAKAPEFQKGAHISDKIKRLEESQQKFVEPPMGGIALLPQVASTTRESTSTLTKQVKFEQKTTESAPIYRPQATLHTPTSRAFERRSASPKPSADAVAMEKLWASPKPFEYESCQSDFEQETKYRSFTSASEAEPDYPLPEEPTKPKTIRETKKLFEEKISQSTELKAPFLVQQAVAKSSPPIPIQTASPFAAEIIDLQPGSPPEICFAPKPEERRKSLVESMEQALEQNLRYGPSKVLPHSVPTLAPPMPTKPTPPPVPAKPSARPSEERKFKPPPPVLPPKFVRGELYESDYESDRWKYSGSESDEPPSFRPFGMRPKSMEIPIVPYKISGYAADTEDIGFKKFESVQESKQFFESKEYISDGKITNGHLGPESYDHKEFKHVSYMSNGYHNQPQIPPPASPSVFRKSEVRESDYSSEREEHIQKMWKASESDAELKGFRSVHAPTPTPTGRRSTTFEEMKSPAHFEQPRKPAPVSVPTRPQPQLHQVHKPKPVAAKYMQTATQAASAPKTTLYYTAVTGAPLHLSKVATETQNSMQIKEATETSRRVVNMEQTKRVIHFDSSAAPTTLEPFPFKPISGKSTPSRLSVPPPATPTKFVRGEFKESDYESEVENAVIRPLWTPTVDELGELRFRHVEPPRSSRSASLPRTYERIISPMEFDRGPQLPEAAVSTKSTSSSSYQTQTMERYSSSKKSNSTRDDMNLTVGSPPKYGYMAASANSHMQDLGSTFRQKSHQFLNDISSDFQKQTTTSTAAHHRPGFKRAPSEGADSKPEAYRNESRVSQFGTKCVDPNTGLIYFKYDFGYEFGILFPGEGKKFIGGVSSVSNSSAPSKKLYPLRESGDIIIPVQHERSYPKQNGLPHGGSTVHPSYCYTTPPMDINLDRLHAKDEICVNGREVPELASNVPVNAHLTRDEYPKRPPIFITPLKDIACVAGQCARFECIVQSDPAETTVTWVKDNFPLKSNNQHFIEFRNGVCRLTIPQAYPEDAGNYICTATTQMGVATTTGQLLVPGNNRGYRK